MLFSMLIEINFYNFHGISNLVKFFPFFLSLRSVFIWEYFLRLILTLPPQLLPVSISNTATSSSNYKKFSKVNTSPEMFFFRKRIVQANIPSRRKNKRKEGSRTTIRKPSNRSLSASCAFWLGKYLKRVIYFPYKAASTQYYTYTACPWKYDISCT